MATVPANPDPDDRFGLLSATVRARIRRDDDHWYWIGGLRWARADALPYGQVYLPRTRRQPGRSKTMIVHRHVYEELVGPIPEGLVLDHLCRETLCCRPSHLEVVTLAENSARVTRSGAESAGPPLRPLPQLDPMEGEQLGLWEES